MRYLDSPLWERWRSRRYVGDNRARLVITWEPDWWLTLSSHTNEQNSGTTGTWSRGPARWWQREDNSQYEIEVPGVIQLDIDRDTSEPIGSATITVANQQMVPTPADGTTIGLPGSLAPRYGGQQIRPGTQGGFGRWDRARPYGDPPTDRWGQTGNEWYGALDAGSVFRSYEGYGDPDKPWEEAVADGDIVQTGVWMCDDTRPGHGGTIVLECRGVGGALLADQRLYSNSDEGIVPRTLYPLRYARWRHLVPGNPATTPGRGTPKDVATTFQGSSTDIVYPDNIVEGRGAPIHGHWPGDAADKKATTYWMSEGYETPNGLEARPWIQFQTWRRSIDGIRIHALSGTYLIYISVMEDGSWAGDNTIPYDPGDGIHTAADIPYVKTTAVPAGQPVVVDLPYRFTAERFRLTFRRLEETRHAPPHRVSLVEATAIRREDAPIGANSGSGAFQPTKVRGNYCADTETEILTPRGWLRWDEVEVGDQSLTIDPATGRASWETITSVFREHRQTPMVAMRGRQHDSLTTPDHRWLTVNKQGKWAWKTTSTLNTASSIPVAAPVNLPEAPTYSDELVELVAWFYTEGSLAENRACVSQSKVANPGHAARIEKILHTLYGPPGPIGHGKAAWRETFNPGGVSIWRLRSDVRDELIALAPDRVPTPAFLAALTAHQIHLFVETSIDADGHRRVDNGVPVFTQADERRTRAFEMACILDGRAPNTTLMGETWSTTVCTRAAVRPIAASRTAAPGRLRIETVDYDDVIWCPTVKHHNWMARRHGKVYFTGNTDYKDIVFDVLMWAGYWLLPPVDDAGEHRAQGAPKLFGNIETTGAWAEEPLPASMFDKRPPLDVLTDTADIVSYLCMEGPDGEIHWHSRNLYAPGNRDELGRPVPTIPLLHEAELLLGHDPTTSMKPLRSGITVATLEPSLIPGNPTLATDGELGDDIVVTRHRPDVKGKMRGVRKPGIWVNGQFVKKSEQEILVELLGMRTVMAAHQAPVEIPGMPLIGCDDQVRVVDRLDSSDEVHYIGGFSSTHNTKTGVYKMALRVSRLGETGRWLKNLDRNRGPVWYDRRKIRTEPGEHWGRILRRLQGRGYPDSINLADVKARNVDQVPLGEEPPPGIFLDW